MSLQVPLRKQLHRHEQCQTSSCLLQASMHSLNEVAVVTNDSLKKCVVQEATSLVDVVAEEMGKVDSMFKCKIKLRGSITNNLKTGRPDEIDFLCHLQKIPIDDTMFSLVNDGSNVKLFSEDIWRENAKGLEGCFQIALLGDSLNDRNKHMQPFIANSVALQNYLSASEVKNRFRLCLKTAVERVKKRQKHRYLYSNNTLIMLPSCVEFGVKIDLTPCLSFQHLLSAPQQFVPSGTVNTWQPVNDDPEDLQVPAVRQTICVLKSLRDIAENSRIEETRFNQIFDVIKEKPAGIFVGLCDISRQLTRVLNQSFLRPTRSNMASYAINSTVVRCYRENPDQSLCCLLLNSIKSFAFQNVEGKPLYRPSVLDKRAQSVLLEMVDVLDGLQLPCTDLKHKIKELVPLYYHYSEGGLVKNLSREAVSIPTEMQEFSIALRSNLPHRAGGRETSKPGLSQSSYCSHTVVTHVFPINSDNLVALLNCVPSGYSDLRRRLQDIHENRSVSNCFLTISATGHNLLTKVLWENTDTLSGTSIQGCLKNIFEHRDFVVESF